MRTTFYARALLLVSAVFCAAAFELACDGADVAPSPPPSPERLPENDARTDPEAPCTTGMPSATSFCALPFEETAFEMVDQWSTTKDGCTQLYVASRGLGERVARVRRYRMTGVDVCGFARDPIFGEVTGYFSAISASEDGAVYALGPGVVRRIAPGPAIDCVGRDVTLGEHGSLAVAPNGRSGYVVWDSIAAPKFARLIVSSNGCELVAFPLDSELSELRQVAGITADAVERLHIVETSDDMALDKQAWIVGADGKTVARYAPSRHDAFMELPRRVTPCGIGTCVPDIGTIAAFTAEGQLLAWESEPGTDGWFSPVAFVGSAGGPLFRIGWGFNQRPGMRVQIVKIP